MKTRIRAVLAAGLVMAFGSMAVNAEIVSPGLAPGAGDAQFNPSNGHFYEVVEGTWDEAEAQGVAKGGHLVTINDAPEQLWLVDTFNMDFPVEKQIPQTIQTKAAYWIGLNDRNQEGTFVWTSGETLAETGFGAGFNSPPWAPLEPSNDTGTGDPEDVVAMNFRICDFAPTFSGCTDFPNSDDPGLWNDYAGNDFVLYGIIEYPPPQYSVDPQGTFMRTDVEDVSSDPVIVDLAANGILPGDLLRIVQRETSSPGGIQIRFSFSRMTRWTCWGSLAPMASRELLRT